MPGESVAMRPSPRIGLHRAAPQRPWSPEGFSGGSVIGRTTRSPASREARGSAPGAVAVWRHGKLLQPQQDAVQGTGNAPEPSGELEQSIAGTEVWVTAQRRAEDLASALERRGATVTIASTLAVQRRIDEATLVERTQDSIGRTPDIVVVTTGSGLRDWLETAASNGLGEGVATPRPARG